MNTPRLAASGAALLIVFGCDANNVAAPSATQSRPLDLASVASQVETSGTFDAIVDFSTITFTPRGSNCLLSVQGRLVFVGTIEGAATGHTDALVSATCDQVATAPPGTYPDVFKSELAFDGTVGGVPAQANVIYKGRSEPGGHISAHLIFSQGVAGVLDVEAQLAVGGAYQGSLVVH